MFIEIGGLYRRKAKYGMALTEFGELFKFSQGEIVVCLDMSVKNDGYSTWKFLTINGVVCTYTALLRYSGDYWEKLC